MWLSLQCIYPEPPPIHVTRTVYWQIHPRFEITDLLFTRSCISQESSLGHSRVNELFMHLGHYKMLGLAQASGRATSTPQARRSIGTLTSHSGIWRAVFCDFRGSVIYMRLGLLFLGALSDECRLRCYSSCPLMQVAMATCKVDGMTLLFVNKSKKEKKPT